MVWIHGGGFFAGSGNPDIYGPEYFMDYDVIVVSVNYRVGPLGFFTLENEEVNCNKFLSENSKRFKSGPDLLIFLKKIVPIPVSILFIFVFSTRHTSNINLIKRRWCAWDSNPGQQNGRRR